MCNYIILWPAGIGRGCAEGEITSTSLPQFARKWQQWQNTQAAVLATSNSKLYVTFQPILSWHFKCAEQASNSSSYGFRLHVRDKKTKKEKEIVAVTHIIGSPIQMQSIKQKLELVILQKEQNTTYLQIGNSLAFYTVELVACCFKACTVTDAAKMALSMSFLVARSSVTVVLASCAGTKRAALSALARWDRGSKRGGLFFGRTQRLPGRMVHWSHSP